jgi:hypothetical protein
MAAQPCGSTTDEYGHVRILGLACSACRVFLAVKVVADCPGLRRSWRS